MVTIQVSPIILHEFHGGIFAVFSSFTSIFMTERALPLVYSGKQAPCKKYEQGVEEKGNEEMRGTQERRNT